MTRWLIVSEWESFYQWDMGKHKETSILYKHKKRALYEFNNANKFSNITPFRSKTRLSIIEIEFENNLVKRSEVILTND